MHRDIKPSEKCSSPYPHVIADDFLESYPGLVADFPDEASFSKGFRMDADLTSSDEGYQSLLRQSKAYRKLHDWVYSPDFSRFFLDLFAPELEMALERGELLGDPRSYPIYSQPYELREGLSADGLPSQKPFLFNRMDLGVGGLGYGRDNGGKGIHIDNYNRIVSALIYLDPIPEMVGGEHRIYDINGDDVVVSKTIPPVGNMMIASIQNNRAFHDVNPITKISGGLRRAIYMALSSSERIWKASEQSNFSVYAAHRYTLQNEG